MAVTCDRPRRDRSDRRGFVRPRSERLVRVALVAASNAGAGERSEPGLRPAPAPRAGAVRARDHRLGRADESPLDDPGRDDPRDADPVDQRGDDPGRDLADAPGRRGLARGPLAARSASCRDAWAQLGWRAAIALILRQPPARLFATIWRSMTTSARSLI